MTRGGRAVLITLIVVLFVGGGLVSAAFAFIPMLTGGSGGMFGSIAGGCSASQSFTDADGTNTTNVSDCLPPGLPSSIPLITGRAVSGDSVTGQNGYAEYDAIIVVTNTDSATQQITKQLTDAGFTVVPYDQSDYDLEFTGFGYDVAMTMTSTGPHGPTVEYYITQSTNGSGAPAPSPASST
ncbi:hypothetical protein [Subtercola endophyticus]|uniref:hypothetical protein n=1 Tax=Subtercola endophyticus TaxID=2895559 RepID=UPI001E2C4817|nr:hypothetical protein [Subtercola endophyticus]UFS60994.1 hypothetical protein LQ955_09795 [Subtercola endophyticus]